MPKYVKTGQKVPTSGQYRPVGSKTEVTFVEGNKVPPTANGTTKFVLVDKTKHKWFLLISTLLSISAINRKEKNND